MSCLRVSARSILAISGRILEFPESSLALRSGILVGLNVAALAAVWIWANMLTLFRRS